MSRAVKRKRTIVRSHWAKLIEDFNTSSLQFYMRVREVLEKREVPGLESCMVNWSEGGMLSAKRTYLRLVRHRLVIDICAAPFGTGFFFSWRLGEVPLKIRWWMLIPFVLVAVLAWLTLFELDETWLGIILIVTLVLCFFLFIKNAFKYGLKDLDAAIMQVPVIAEIYERHLRKVTYYRIDSMLMYEQAVHAAVMEVLDEVTSEQGVASLSEADRKPIMRDVYAKAR